MRTVCKGEDVGIRGSLGLVEVSGREDSGGD